MFKIERNLTQAESMLLVCNALLKLSYFKGNSEIITRLELKEKMQKIEPDLVAGNEAIEVFLDGLVKKNYIKLEDCGMSILNILSFVHLTIDVTIIANEFNLSDKL